MRVAYITAGAAGMICGSCLRDNSLVRALSRLGCEALLVPVYTPVRVDEEDSSIEQVFLGGINVFLQQKSSFFRRLPPFLDRSLSHPSLLRRVAKRSLPTDARLLGEITISMLQGRKGYQAKEIDRLVHFLADSSPDLVNLTNILIAGMVPDLKEKLDVPVVVTLQGDDLFLTQLAEPYQERALACIREIVPWVDKFIVFTEFYAERMSSLLGIPSDRIEKVPLGVTTHDLPKKPRQPFSPESRKSRRVGYLARVSPEKGLDLLVDGFIELLQMEGAGQTQLHVAGWLGEAERPYLEAQLKKMAARGVEENVFYHGVLDRKEKLDFIGSLDVFCVPTRYEEPKGLYVLESLGCGVPVVQPQHGAFPELIGQLGGGLLFEPGDPNSLARTLHRVLMDPALALQLGQQGHHGVHGRATAEIMAAETLAVYRSLVS